MKVQLFILLVLLVPAVVGCRTRRETLAVSTQRHSDSVATLRSIVAREVTVETETTVITMRPDTLGNLVEVARDVVRTFTRQAENATSDTVAAFRTETMQDTIQTTEKAAEATQHARKGFNWFVAGVWVGFAALVALLAFVIIRKGLVRWN